MDVYYFLNCYILKKFQNTGESRIPVPRAVRPSFLPKSRLVGSSKIGSHHQGHRRSNILSSCLTFTEHDDGGASTQRAKFPGGLFASSPSAKRNKIFYLMNCLWKRKNLINEEAKRQERSIGFPLVGWVKSFLEILKFPNAFSANYY